MNEIVRLIPTPQSHIITEDEVSIARLQSVLEAAVFDVKMDRDGDLYVTDGLEFPSWVRLPEDEKLIIFVTSVVSQRYSNKLNWLGDIRSSEACGRCESS
jgi:hypothetical protein